MLERLNCSLTSWGSPTLVRRSWTEEQIKAAATACAAVLYASAYGNTAALAQVGSRGEEGRTDVVLQCGKGVGPRVGVGGTAAQCRRRGCRLGCARLPCLPTLATLPPSRPAFPQAISRGITKAASQSVKGHFRHPVTNAFLYSRCALIPLSLSYRLIVPTS